jgi:NAD(P)-dependent dehydrogenase (short-subunit alcohol dehydrogenase family)
MTGRLSGAHAVIVGAAGGIGSAAARAFVDEGAIVGLLDLPGHRLSGLQAKLGPRTMTLSADLTSEESVAAAFQRWSDEHDALTALYVCSGIQLHAEDGPVHTVSLATWQETYRVNAAGTFLACKYAIPLMQRSGGGSVLLCGSPTAVTMTGRGYSAYASSKGAVMSLSRVIAADYAGDGIRCNVILPGAVRTPLISDLTADDAIRCELERGTPLGRLAEPADLTGIAVFLASTESNYATGAVFTVDGGVTAR